MTKAARSSRALFRATGKTAKPVVIPGLEGPERAAEVPREENDFYPTPAEPTRAILHAERALFARFSAVWEPACGNGAMVREIEAVGKRCIASDLVKRWDDGAPFAVKDFLAEERAPFDAILFTNPPFALCNESMTKGVWLWHALDRLRVPAMILLLPWQWPGAAGNARLWSTYPPARVWLMRWRVDFTGGGAPPMLNAWYVWERGHKGPTELHMLDRADARQAVLL